MEQYCFVPGWGLDNKGYFGYFKCEGLFCPCFGPGRLTSGIVRVHKLAMAESKGLRVDLSREGVSRKHRARRQLVRQQRGLLRRPETRACLRIAPYRLLRRPEIGGNMPLL